ncbi:MAG TPA: hypothetical protein VMH86_09225 [Rhizomicrobium sp.]|nr:hypothetical protein [Rhizomicrobium sp.]
MTRRLKMYALATVAAVGLASPAFADWDNIGSVHVDYGVDRDTRSPDFGGPVERLRFMAANGDVQCRYIRAEYANGSSGTLFTGMLRQGAPHNVDVPGTQRNIRRLDFLCRSFSHGGADIRMDADVGQYRAQWRASPEWARTWSRFMHWADNSFNRMTSPDNWAFIGSASFRGRDDHDGTVAGWGGRNVTEIGFKPVNGDAVCGRVNVRFGNGVVRPYTLNNGGPMHNGRVYSIDMPGNTRNVTDVAMRCHALGQYAVTIDIYGNK